MELNDPLHALESTILLAAKIWKVSVDICKPKPGIAQEVINLYSVMSRALQVATSKGCAKHFWELCKGTNRNLNDCRSIMLAYKALGEHGSG